MRFCSGCGFPLVVVSQLVAGGGKVAAFDEEGKPQLTRRQKSIRLATLLMLISGFLACNVLWMTAMKPDALVLIFPVLIVFIVGLVRLVLALSRQENTLPARDTSSFQTASQLQFSSATVRGALSAHESVPIHNRAATVNTSEMLQPPSVTENTTRTLTQSKPIDE
jgi:hypothetical protein